MSSARRTEARFPKGAEGPSPLCGNQITRRFISAQSGVYAATMPKCGSTPLWWVQGVKSPEKIPVVHSCVCHGLFTRCGLFSSDADHVIPFNAKKLFFRRQFYLFDAGFRYPFAGQEDWSTWRIKPGGNGGDSPRGFLKRDKLMRRQHRLAKR